MYPPVRPPAVLCRNSAVAMRCDRNVWLTTPEISDTVRNANELQLRTKMRTPTQCVGTPGSCTRHGPKKDLQGAKFIHHYVVSSHLSHLRPGKRPSHGISRADNGVRH